jgi:hypothetical protein
MNRIDSQCCHNKNSWRGLAAAGAAVVVAACGGGDPAAPDGRAAAQAASASCAARVNNTFDKLLECVTLDGVRRHQQALQTIADENNGIRTSGTPGYDASVAYAEKTFRGQQHPGVLG